MRVEPRPINPTPVFRDADARDLADLSSLMLASGHGVIELLYEGLLPERALTDVLIERRFLNPQSFAHLSNWRVACRSACNFDPLIRGIGVQF